ncbi:spindle assembly abnormal protein 6 homolog isoform X2 [Liolophura sinensis]|uniref:spindle assembly abnormal protein 6 homolog isoform X2 n=1 Tax=Liolophura sinensis TaxID=3198878 RepID=UPI0031581356
MADELFGKQLPVVWKSPDREDRKVKIFLKMEVQTVTTPLHRKELVVRLTDDQDLFFLYTLRLSEEDFQSLKTQQGLLVDFGSFPQKFIDLLNMCIQEEHREVPKFILHLVSQSSLAGETTAATLNVIETNPFKHLTHLSLKFLPGKDSDIKKYLADCLKQMQDRNSLLQHKYEHTDADLNQRLRQTQEMLSQKSSELESLKTEWTAKLTELTAKHKQELTEERERTLETQRSYQSRHERERKELEQAHMKIVKQLEGRLYELEGSSKDLTDRKYKSEANIRELKSKLGSLEEEHQRAKQEIQTLRKQNAALDGEYHEQEKIINQQRMRVAVLEQEVKDKEQVIARSSDLLGSEQGQKRKYEEDLEAKQKEIGRLESKVKAMSEELLKGNEIIKKLQGEIKNYHTKIKLRNQIATEQEKLLKEKDQELETLRKDLSETKETLKKKTDESEKLSTDLRNTMEKLEESRQLLKTNENVIQWLNKQINDTQITHRQTGTFEMPAVNNFRHTSGMHNYSVSSYGSVRTSVPSEGPGGGHYPGAIQHPYHPPPNRHAQVQYNPGQPKKSALPLATGHKISPVPSIPEEIRPNSSPSSNSTSTDKENDPPVIDPKFLHRREGAIPVRGLVSRSASPPTIHTASLPAHTSNRLSQQAVVPKTLSKPSSQPPLASAYFPKQTRPS